MSTTIRVLVVDDSDDFLFMLSRLFKMELKENGFAADVVGVLDGETGLNTAINDGPFDLVLSDIGLPKIDGLEVVRRLRKAGVTTPVICMSADTDRKEMQEKSLEAGANDFLPKPIDFSELTKKMWALWSLEEKYRPGSPTVLKA